MILLVNTNRMQPPIAPLGLDYVATAVRRAGRPMAVVDLCLADQPERELREALRRTTPDVVGLSFRNYDDSLWPSGQVFLGDLVSVMRTARSETDAPIVLGGVGFSIFAERILAATGAEFGIRGDGEAAITRLLEELSGQRRFEQVPGLLWRDAAGQLRVNAPAWPAPLTVPTERDAVDNDAYFRRGGQLGFETKRGCPAGCIYCADPLAKGTRSRLRAPAEVADEVEGLVQRGWNVLHTCDSEFNQPADHARAVCEEFVRRGLGDRATWYAYATILPLDAELVKLMARAGCRGINFTTNSASATMLAAYGERHRAADIARAVAWCKESGVEVMLDLLMGGPGETPETARESIEALKRIGPTCAGVALGVQLYPGTAIVDRVRREGPLETNPAIHRDYDGPVDLFRPTFYLSPALGDEPASLVKDLIGGDTRFFPPADPKDGYNYNDNRPLVDAIAAGARGAYWHILHHLRTKHS
jgi:radical SAM superfamily enzyme YgiQ (UPF0313 family)